MGVFHGDHTPRALLERRLRYGTRGRGRARVAHPDDGDYYEFSPSVCAVHREATASAKPARMAELMPEIMQVLQSWLGAGKRRSDCL